MLSILSERDKKMRSIIVVFLIATALATEITHAKAQSVDTTIYTQVDVIPQFSKGVRGWNDFLNKNLDIKKIQWSIDEETYAKYGLIQRAQLEFTVCEDGTVCDIEVLNAAKISPEFAEEVLRVMNKSPKWKPALLDGRPVRTRFRQPVTVNLKE